MKRNPSAIRALCTIAVVILVGTWLCRRALERHMAARDTTREWTQVYDVLNALMEVSEAVRQTGSDHQKPMTYRKLVEHIRGQVPGFDATTHNLFPIRDELADVTFGRNTNRPNSVVADATPLYWWHGISDHIMKPGYSRPGKTIVVYWSGEIRLVRPADLGNSLVDAQYHP